MISTKLMEDYLYKKDWRVNENSNVGHTFGGLVNYISSSVMARYWLDEIYNKEIADAHTNCDVHIHDLGFFSGYCNGIDLKTILLNGIRGVHGQTSSSPPSHFESALNMALTMLMLLQSEFAGAQAYSNFDTLLAPYIKKDGLTYDEVYQNLQNFVWSLNYPTRLGSQAPFTNLTFDVKVPKSYMKDNPMVGEKLMDFTYADCQEEMNMINKAFMAIMVKGDSNGKGFPYPIPTYSITKDFDWDNPVIDQLFEMAGIYGIPYFQNLVNSNLNPEDIRSMALLGSQDLIYMDKYGVISKNEIRHLVKQWNKDIGYKVLMNGKFIDVIDMFEVPYENYDKYVTLKLENGYKQHFSWQHKCLIYRNGEIINEESQNITDKDSMLISTKGYYHNNLGDFELGKIVGYFLGDGWIMHDDCQLRFSLGYKKEEVKNSINRFFQKLGCRVEIIDDKENNSYIVDVYGKQSVGLVKQYINGLSAKTKRLGFTVWNMSWEFRCGLFEGLYETDGCIADKVLTHTTNKNLCDDLIMLAASLGRVLRYTEKENSRYFKEDKSDKVDFKSYVLRVVDKYKTVNHGDYEYYIVPVSEVKTPKSKANTVYNFTVNTKDHLFELPNGIVTHQCCRLSLDLTELRNMGGGLFGAEAKTGSIGVVTVNLPRIAYLSNNKREFFERLDSILHISKDSLEIKRATINEWLDKGLYPYTKEYVGSFRTFFSTIGLVGGNEMCLNFLGQDILSDDGKAFMLEVMDFIREKIRTFQIETGHLYNLEQTPAESTSGRLARKDHKLYPQMVIPGGESAYYTNSVHIPVDKTTDVFEVFAHQQDLVEKFTGGSVVHIFLGESLNDFKVVKSLVKKLCKNFKIPYFTLSPTYSVCDTHGFLKGEHFECPKCKEETLYYEALLTKELENAG